LTKFGSAGRSRLTSAGAINRLVPEPIERWPCVKFEATRRPFLREDQLCKNVLRVPFDSLPKAVIPTLTHSD